jgi:hypothetical protein
MTAEELVRRLERHLSRPARLGYVALLLGGLTVAALVAVLWATEPGGLPARTQSAFAGFIAIGMAWSGLAAWALTRRRPLYAADRVVAGYLAVAVTTLATLAVVAIAVSRGQVLAVAVGSGVGAVTVTTAVLVTISARRRRASLLARRQELQESDT